MLDIFNKRVIPEQIFSINPNAKQKYKAIFGLDLLCKNGIDFISSKKMIEWEGIRIPLENHGESKWNALEKNIYQTILMSL